MRLSKRTLSSLAEMICGEHGTSGIYAWDNFPYRSSSSLSEFFYQCDMEYMHDGTTRKSWVLNVLEEIDTGPPSNPNLPSDGMIRVIQELMDPAEFQHRSLDRLEALNNLNDVLARDGLAAYLDESGLCHVRNLGTKVSSYGLLLKRAAWTEKEETRRKQWVEYLENASEDQFIQQFLHPLFRRMGFIRISITGHKDKRLEFGKDLWMKFQLPTDHSIYFGAQVKKTKLDAAGRSSNTNISEVLTQIRMMLDHPIWDPENNRRHLLDHVFIISAGEITKQAKNWLARHLDQESRRHILFMDRDDILDLAVNYNMPLPTDETDSADDYIPF